jgi:hypothetical protein
MTALAILICIFNVSLLVLIAGCAWYLSKIMRFQKDSWISFTNLHAELSDMNKQIKEVQAFLKLTFNKKFADKVEDMMHIKENIPSTVRVLCDDNKWHDLPEDKGF